MPQWLFPVISMAGGRRSSSGSDLMCSTVLCYCCCCLYCAVVCCVVYVVLCFDMKVTVPVRNLHDEQLMVCVSAQATVVSILLKLATMLKVEASRDLALFEVLESLSIGECAWNLCTHLEWSELRCAPLPLHASSVSFDKFDSEGQLYSVWSDWS